MIALPFSLAHQLGEFQWQYFHTVAENADFLPDCFGQTWKRCMISMLLSDDHFEFSI